LKRHIPFLTVILLLFFLVSSVMAEEMKLDSDRMEYDPDKGSVYASGNVLFTRNELDINADRAEGKIDGSSALFWDSVKGEGFLNGESVNFVCDKLQAEFKDPVYYSLNGNVDAKIGTRHIIADSLDLSGNDLEAFKISHFSDSESGITVSGEKMEGTIVEDLIEDMIVEKNVRLTLEGNNDQKTVITGDKAVYSKQRGTIVVSGNAKAVQSDRIITASNLVFFPGTQKIEATGDPRIVFRMNGDKEKE